MSVKDGAIEMSLSNAYVFTNTAQDDLIIRTFDTIGLVHIGPTPDAALRSPLCVSSSNVIVNSNLVVRNNIDLDAPANSVDRSITTNAQLTWWANKSGAANFCHSVFVVGSNNSAGDHVFYTRGNSIRMRIFSDGTITAASNVTLSAGDLSLSSGGIRVVGSGDNGTIKIAPTTANAESAIAFFPSSTFTANDANRWVIGNNSFGVGTGNLALGSGGTARMVLQSGGNVGIGVTSPAVTLEVGGGAKLGSGVSVSGPRLQLWNSDTSNSFHGLGLGNSQFQLLIPTPGHNIGFGIWSNYSFSELMRLTGDGNLGLGTTSPTVGYKLDVIGSTRTSSFLYSGTGTGATNSNTHPGLCIGATSTQNAVIIADISGKVGMTMGLDQSDSRFKLQVGGSLGSGVFGSTPIITATSSAVGISTTTPGHMLDVNGNTRVSGGLFVGTPGSACNAIFFAGTAGDFENTNPYAGILTRTFDPNNGTTATSDYSELLMYQMNDAPSAYGPDRIRFIAAAHKFQVYSGSIGPTTTNTFFADSNYTTAMYMDPNGNVGIGTTTPSAQLDVNGVIRGNSNIALFSANRLNIFNSNGALQIRSGLACNLELNGDNAGNVIACSGGGNFGIGTVPNTKLDVNGVATFRNVMYANNQVQNCVLALWQQGGSGSVSMSSLKYLGMGVSTNILRYQVDVSTANHVFYTDSNELVRITGTGNLGIGTSAPSYKLDVLGGARVIQNGTDGSLRIAPATSNEESSIAFYSNSNIITGDINRWVIGQNSYSAGVGNLAIGNGTSMRMMINSSGNVGIGHSAPSSRLVVSSPSNNGALKVTNTTGNPNDEWWIGFCHGNTNSGDDNDRVRIGANIRNGGAGRFWLRTGSGGTGQTIAMWVDENQNVGIGNGSNTPASRLDVNGQITIANDANNWTSGGIRFYSTSTAQDSGIAQNNGGILQFRAPANDGANGYDFRSSGSSNSLVRILNSGFIGIGSNVTPPSLLSLLNPNGTGGFYFEAGALTNNTQAGWHAINVNGYTSSSDVRVNTNKVRWRFIVDQRNTLDDFYVDTWNGSAYTNIMRINSAGNFAIGSSTINTTYRAEITGSIRVLHSSTQAIVIRQTTATNTSMPAEIVFDRQAQASTQHAAVGMDNPGRNFFIYVNGGDRLNIDTSGRVGIGTQSPGYTLEVVGAIYASGDITALSDRRHKTNITPIMGALDKVLAINGYTYNRKDISERDQEDVDKKYVGVIAQEVVNVLPEVVTYDKMNDKYGVNYGNMVAVLVEAMKDMRREYTAQIDDMKQQIASLQATVAALQACGSPAV